MYPVRRLSTLAPLQFSCPSINRGQLNPSEEWALTRMTAAVPSWQQDLNAQVLHRNRTELHPCRTLFQSYAALYARSRNLPQIMQQRAQLQDENTRLADRVRALERAAADSSVRFAREAELEKKRDELQDRLQLLMNQENTYYKGMAELSTWKARTAAAEDRVETLEQQLSRCTSEFSLVRKEYAALADENQVLRKRSSAELQTTLLDLESAKETIVQMGNRIAMMSSTIENLQQQCQLQQPLSSGGASPLIAEHQDPNSRRLDSVGGENETDSGMRPSEDAVIYPTGPGIVIKDAHDGAMLQSICMSESTRSIFTSGADKKIRVHETQKGSRTATIPIGQFVLSMDTASHYLLAGCTDSIARFYDLSTTRALELVGHSQKIVAACLSSSAQHGFTASSDSTIKLWDMRRQAAIKTLLCPSTANDVCVVGESIYAAHYNGCISTWDRRTASRTGEVRSHQRLATCVRVSPDGRLCLSVGRDNTVCVRDTRQLSREVRNIAPSSLVVSHNWSRLAVSPDSAVCAVGSAEGDVLLLPLHDALMTVSADGVMTTLERRPPPSRAVLATVWGRNARMPLVSIAEDGCVVVWH